ncbi:YsnF/AvaK domain-containing protein [Nocardioides ochotonae]|uniref:YsnF/AvaK domain-containing protein n=1 Tax=Nocardioides ochotonae TaxID=2685869 RepID=UPI00140E43C3|nr:YsnF/AvaK domain-containing protein [Nocardioides ochotonae]
MNDTDSGATAPGEEPVAETTRHEERAEIGTETHEAGRIRVRKHVEDVPVAQTVAREVEHADASERVPAGEGDSGEVETLPDGSISIPLFEEVLVVTKKRVVRERIIVRKQTVVEEQTVEAEVRREHVTIEADDGVEVERRDRGPS